MQPCKYSSDGVCIRPENDYCHASECLGCKHTDTHLAVIDAQANCEVTAIQCLLCGELLTEPETDCR